MTFLFYYQINLEEFMFFNNQKAYSNYKESPGAIRAERNYP